MRLAFRRNKTDSSMIEIVTYTMNDVPVVWCVVLEDMIEDDCILRALKAHGEWEGELKYDGDE